MKKSMFRYMITVVFMITIILVATNNAFADEKEFTLIKIVENNSMITKDKGFGEVLGYTYTNQEVFLNKVEDDWALITSSDGTIEGYVKSSAIGIGIEKTDVVNRSHVRTSQDAIIELAKSKLGTPYSYGASGPNKFDCSGFVSYVMKNAAGISLPRTSSAMGGSGVAVSKAELAAGDLILFNTNGNPSSINHVGIYIGEGKFIHCASGKTMKVIISDINSSYYRNAYHSARRVL